MPSISFSPIDSGGSLHIISRLKIRSFVSFIYTYPTFRSGFCDRGPFSGCKLITYCVPFIAFPISVLAAYGLPLQSGNLFPSVLSKRDKLLPHGGEHLYLIIRRRTKCLSMLWGKLPHAFQKTETSFCLSFIFRFLQSSYYTGKVCIDTDRLFCDGIWADSFSQIDAGVNRFRVLIGHLPKRIFDDSRSIAAYAQFRKRICRPVWRRRKSS